MVGHQGFGRVSDRQAAFNYSMMSPFLLEGVPKNMSGDKGLLHDSAQLLSRRIAALEDFLSVVRKKLKLAAIRTSQYTWRQLKLILWNLLYLFQLAASFWVLALFASTFHELTFLQRKAFTVIGWLGISIVAFIAIWGLGVVIFRSKSKEPEGKSHIGSQIWTIVFAFLALDLVAICTPYRLHSPLLRSMQISSLAVTNHFAPFVTGMRSSDLGTHIFQKSELRVSNPLTSGPQAVSVQCKTDDGKTWVTDVRDAPLNMWVERAWLENDKTTLDLAVKTWYPSVSAELERADDAYIVDNLGRVYGLSKDSGEYTFFRHVHLVLGDQTYRFQLTFHGGLDHQVTYLKIHHPQFEILTVNLQR